VLRRKVDEEEQLKKTGKRILIGTFAFLALAILANSANRAVSLALIPYPLKRLRPLERLVDTLLDDLNFRF
jgi:hypothetical protein